MREPPRSRSGRQSRSIADVYKRQALGYLISPLDVIPDAIPIAGLGDDLAVLLFVLKKVWGEVSEDVKAKSQYKLKKWFDEEEIPSADDLFKDSATDTPV